MFWLIQPGNGTDFGMFFFSPLETFIFPLCLSTKEANVCEFVSEFENQHTLCYYYSVGSRKLSWSVRNTVYSRDLDALYIHFEPTSLEQVEVLRVIWDAPSSNHGI